MTIYGKYLYLAYRRATSIPPASWRVFSGDFYNAGVLELSKGDYLSKYENIVLIGNMGTGKTHTTIALGLLDLLIVDEVGFVPFTPKVAHLLFQAFSERYLKGESHHYLKPRVYAGLTARFP
ncbi:ATP-binding protein [Chloroflexota bacterium]